MDEYFRRHDGQAVTCEDFVAAMAAASGFRLRAVHALVRAAGTPHVAVSSHYDAQARRYTLSFTQSNPRASDNRPYLIPIRVALFDTAGTLLDGSARTLVLMPRHRPSISTASRRNRCLRCCATFPRR
jgi:aminopeptidase N